MLLSSIRRFAFLSAAVVLFMALPGCYNHPVRHLASDVGLIKAGETTRQEVLALLGKPDSTRMVSADTEEWAYHEEDKSLLQKAPLVGEAFSAQGYKTVVLTLKGDLVTAVHFVAYDKDEFDWKDDCKWKDIDRKTDKKTGQ